jgi:hypothetical protein
MVRNDPKPTILKIEECENTEIKYDPKPTIVKIE